MELNPYAIYLNGQDPLPVLSTTADRLRTLTAGLTAAQINTPPAPRKWSICNIATHLADCEVVFSFRLRQTLAPALDQPHTIIQPFDQDAWATRYAAYQFEPALALFQAARNWTCSSSPPSRRTTVTAPPPTPNEAPCLSGPSSKPWPATTSTTSSKSSASP
jgi:hypothetical protein